MTDEEFRDLLDRRGGNLDAWPDAERRAARRLLAGSVIAQSLLDETTTMELALAEPQPGPAPGLANRIFEAAFGAEPGSARPDRTGKAPPLA